MHHRNARQAALEILLRIERDHSFADVLLDKELSANSLRGPDRGLLTELVFGVLRRRGTLDHIIHTLAARKSPHGELPIMTLLRLGLYQIFFLDRVPVSAAVNETVNLAKIVAPRAAGFINAILRRADRERESLSWPNRDTDFTAFLAARYSEPRWLIEQWLDQLPGDEVEQLATILLEPPPLTLRANTLRIGRDELIEQLNSGGFPAQPTRYAPCGIHIRTTTHPGSLPGFAQGLFTVQDESSQLAAQFLAPDPGQQVLDLCAAPGGKTTHLAQLMKNSGTILACDLDKRKLPRIAETATRLGISTIETMAIDGSHPLNALTGRQFDRILVDAPCTGLGVIRRNPEAKWRLAAADVCRLADLQGTILANASALLAPGGVLLYSTCSTSREENEGVIDDFLSKHTDFMLEDLRKLFPEFAPIITDRGIFRAWPHRHGMDGFCAMRLTRIR